MGLFDYPRLNFKGAVQVNPGTANNDDYAGSLFMPKSWGAMSGATLGLLESKRVEPRTYGMSDDPFIEWAQKEQPFVNSKGLPKKQIPAEWNYYGDMSMSYQVAIVGVQEAPGELYDRESGDGPLAELLGLGFSFSGAMTDVNPEGSPPATQFFLGQLKLEMDGKTLLQGSPSKGVGEWMNFYRNVNLTQDAGSGTYVYHVVPTDTLAIPGFDRPGVCGVVFRYYLYRAILDNPDADIEELYRHHETNPKTLELVGTIAPLFENERIVTTPPGRLLVWDTPNIPTPAGYENNGPGGHGAGRQVALGPAIVQRDGDLVHADFVGSFPENYQDGINDKFDFGPVALGIASGSDRALIDGVEYADTAAGDARGWIYEFDLSNNPEAQALFERDDARVELVQRHIGPVLSETDYFFVTNQLAVYGEQHRSGTRLVNQGTEEPARITVFHRGRELPADTEKRITVWQYRSTPLQSPGNAEVVTTQQRPGQPIEVDTSQPGNLLLTFTISDPGQPAPEGFPPESYGTFMMPPYVTNAPQINIRVLPNEEDFSGYYEDPDADEPVANEQLTFEILYEKVLRTYFLLYPSMTDQAFSLRAEPAVARHADKILERTDPKNWMSLGYMPKTRDLSASRRTLLRAWCHRVLGHGARS